MFAEAPTSIESLSGAVMLLECRALLYKKELTGYNSRRRSTLKRTEKVWIALKKNKKLRQQIDTKAELLLEFHLNL